MNVGIHWHEKDKVEGKADVHPFMSSEPEGSE
jgi:hypothetical protein